MSELFEGKDPFVKLFGGKDPFDDPFFTHPFRDLFDEKNLFDNPFFTSPFDSHAGFKKQITIDDDTQKQSSPSKENGSANVGTESFSFRRVAYGDLNGMYYTSAILRRDGGDGVALVEAKEEDKTTGQSIHTTSRGIRDKGLSFTTQQNPNGRVDSLQTLHNLNEGELAGFEENWKVNADWHLPGWNNGLNLIENAGANCTVWDGLGTWGGWALPSTEHWGDAGEMEADGEARALSSRRRGKKVVPVNIESSSTP